LALQASGGNGAETLGFMVQTNLIEDAEIRKGVIAYLDSKKPVPQLAQLQAQQLQAAAESFDQASGQTVRSPDGRVMAKALLGGRVNLFDTYTQQIVRSFFQAEITAITAMSFSPDSRKLIIVGDNNSVSIWGLEGAANLIAVIKLPWRPDFVKFSDNGEKIIARHGEEEAIYDEKGNKVNSK
jgi:WD40 repeat protein